MDQLIDIMVGFFILVLCILAVLAIVALVCKTGTVQQCFIPLTLLVI